MLNPLLVPLRFSNKDADSLHVRINPTSEYQELNYTLNVLQHIPQVI